MNYHGIFNSNNVIQSEWSKKLIPLHNDVKTLPEFIEIRDGYKECFGFTQEECKDTNHFIANLNALNNVCFIYLVPYYIGMYLFLKIYIIHVLSLTLPL